MKKMNYFYLVALATILLSACGSTVDGGDTPAPAPSITTYSGVITENVSWTKDNVYTLAGRVVVPSGVTLTIEAGTVIKANSGQESNACALIVARGGKIMAEGTAAEPIIFTSTADQITNSHSNYPGFANFDESYKGEWGGLIVLGNANISADAAAIQIEGIPASDSNGLYGGSNDADNSGVIRYVQIRHGGTLLGEGNEINGLTLGGVGSGTTVEYVEVLGNVDDGIECFGGAVNINHVLVWAQGDDAFDIDQGYSGTINNFYGIADAESDHGLEIDGPEGSMLGAFSLTNGTLIGYNDDAINGEYADFRDGARGSLDNLLFQNFSCGSDFELDDDVTSANATAGNLSFSSLIFDVSHLNNTCNTTIADICMDKSTGSFSDFGATVGSSGGADLSKFNGWTCYNN